MPNWADNEISFEGPEADIQNLIERHIAFGEDGEETLDFESLVPMPADVTEEETRDWRIKNWGVKWEAVDFLEQERSEGAYAIGFATPWSCPTPIFHVLASSYPRLRSRIFASEPGMEWAYLGYSDGGLHEGFEISFPQDWDRLVPLLEDLEFEAFKDLVGRLNAPRGSDQRDAARDAVDLAMLLDSLDGKLPTGSRQRFAFEQDVANHPIAASGGIVAKQRVEFLSVNDRMRTDLDREMMERLSRHLLQEVWSDEDGPAASSLWQEVVNEILEDVCDEDLLEWAACAMFRPGISFDMSSTAAIREGAIVYATALRHDVLDHIYGDDPRLVVSAA